MVRKLSLLALCVALITFCGAYPAFSQDQSAAAAGEAAPADTAPASKEQGPMLPMVRGDFRDLKVTGQREKVTDIIDGVTIVINHRTKVRLTGIWVPWETDNEPGDTVKKAAKLLEKMAQGQMVRLYQVKSDSMRGDNAPGRTNRLGQQLAQVERQDGLWLQGALLYAGLATVMTSADNPEGAQRMYALEADARKRKAGLWADPRWDVLNPAQVKQYVNEYRIVEGKVFSTAMRNNIFYINFSRDWKTDFTVAISSEKRLAFSRQGVNLMGLNGKTIRVRGWVRNYNGPLIEITHAQQIEVIN